MENKIKTNIIHKVKRLIVQAVKRMLNGPTVITYDRPTHRDIHLNSSAAIRIWLAMVDRPLAGKHSDIMHEGGGRDLHE